MGFRGLAGDRGERDAILIMKRLISLLAVMLALTASAQHQRVIVETTTASRQFLTNDTVSEMITMLFGTPSPLGITSLDGLTQPVQTFTAGGAGSDFNITSDGISQHIINLPTATASVRGLLTAADWSRFNAATAGTTNLAGPTVTGLLRSNDWVTFNAGSGVGKLAIANNLSDVATPTAALTNIGAMAATNATGIRAVGVNEAGLSAVTPLTATEFVWSTDSMLHRATGTGAGNWTASNSIFGIPGALVAGGLYGASLNGGGIAHIMRANGLNDHATLTLEGSNSFTGISMISDVDYNEPWQEMTLAIDCHTIRNSYYEGNWYLQSNPRATDYTSPANDTAASFGIGHYNLTTGAAGLPFNSMFFNSTNGDILLFNSHAQAATGQTNMRTGPIALNIDGTLGIKNLSTCSTNAITGAGTVGVTNSQCSGLGTAFLSTVNVGDFIVPTASGQLLVLAKVNDTNLTVMDVGNASLSCVTVPGGTGYTIVKSAFIATGLQGATNTFLTVNGGIVANKSTGGQDIHLDSSGTGIGAGFYLGGSLINIHNYTGTGSNPFGINTNAPDSAALINGSGALVLANGLNINGNYTNKASPINGAFMGSDANGAGAWTLNAGSLTNLSGANVAYATNAQTTLVNMGQRYSDVTTNATFAWVGYTGLSATNYQFCTIFLTNTSGGVINFTAPVNTHTNGTFNCTNSGVTKIEFIANGNRWTNATATPLF